jgi:hypothetical protein
MQLSHLSPENHSRFFWAVVIMVLSLTFWIVPDFDLIELYDNLVSLNTS